jgi:hypothetical protein
MQSRITKDSESCGECSHFCTSSGRGGNNGAGLLQTTGQANKALFTLIRSAWQPLVCSLDFFETFLISRWKRRDVPYCCDRLFSLSTADPSVMACDAVCSDKYLPTFQKNVYIRQIVRWTKLYAGFEIPTAVVMQSSIFRDIMPWSPLKVNRRFRGQE